MNLVKVSSVEFGVLSRRVREDRSIPALNTEQSIGGSELYLSDGQCEKCYPITDYCRGHFGKILFETPHIVSIYESAVSNFLRFLCSNENCGLPVRMSSKISQRADVAKYYKLVAISEDLCGCTGERAKSTPSDQVDKLLRAYAKYANHADMLSSVFGIDEQELVLRDYLLVLPTELLDQVHEGAEVKKAYYRLLKCRRKTTDEILRAIDEVYKKTACTIGEKPGIFRKLLLPRRVDSSARAVIISNPWIGLEDVSIPSTLSSAICSDINVTAENFAHCIENIIGGTANYISYGKRKYKFSSNLVHAEIHFQLPGDMQNTWLVNVERDDLLVLIPKASATTQEHTKWAIEQVDGTNICKILDLLKGDTYWIYAELKSPGSQQRLDLAQLRQCLLADLGYVQTWGLLLPAVFEHLVFVDVIAEGEVYKTQKIPLQVGCSINMPSTDQEILAHRNPTLSANSMHIHYPRIEQVGNNAVLSVTERQRQRERIAETRTPIEFGNFGFEDLRNSAIFSAAKLAQKSPHISDYTLLNVSSSIINTAYDINSSIGFNQMAVGPYNGDFDGDEMNLWAIGSGLVFGNISLLADCEKGVFGPTHDAKYGLYIVLNDRIGITNIVRNYAPIILREYTKNLNACKSYACHDDLLLDSGLSHSNILELRSYSSTQENAEQEYCDEMLEDSYPHADMYSDLAELENIFHEHLFVSLELNPGKPDTALVGHMVQQLERLLTFCSAEYLSYSYNRSVEDFVATIRLAENRAKLCNNKSYNKFFASYCNNAEKIPLLDSEYRPRFSTHRKIMSQFYSDIARYFYCICDKSALSFTRLDRKNAKDVLDSGCRPKKGVYHSIYETVGFITLTYPDSQELKHVQNNYATGVTEDEYVSMCYPNRAQVVNKGINIAPEGDNMRLASNYMSDMKIDGGIWKFHGTQVCREIGKDTLAEISEQLSATGYASYVSTLTPESAELQYRQLSEISTVLRNARKKILHIGQRKLLMSEIDFLTDFYRDGDIVVYAGAASGSHIPVLLDLFPTMHLELYDKSHVSGQLYDKVKHKPLPRVKIYSEYLTPEIARARYLNTAKVLYISDIRTKLNASAKNPETKDIVDNNELNSLIVRAMNPRHCMLKFRLPYETGATIMPIGELRLQCWSGPESTEVRLVASYPYAFREYNHTKHERQMYYHNTMRPYKVDDAVVGTHLRRQLRVQEKDLYYDMYREQHIVTKYVSSRGKEENYLYERMTFVLAADISYYTAKRDLFWESVEVQSTRDSA